MALNEIQRRMVLKILVRDHYRKVWGGVWPVDWQDMTSAIDVWFDQGTSAAECIRYIDEGVEFMKKCGDL